MIGLPNITFRQKTLDSITTCSDFWPNTEEITTEHRILLSDLLDIQV